MQLQKEIWKDVIGFEGIYKISNHGNIKSFKKFKHGYILSNVNKKREYFSVVLTSKIQNPRYTRIHVLVAEHFIGERPSKKHQIHHKDGNKQNNYFENLEYLSIKDHSKETVRQNPQMLNKMIEYNRVIRPKAIVQYDTNGKYLNEYKNAKEASLNTSVCGRNILQVANKTPYGKNSRIRSQAGGYIWKLKAI